MASKKANKPKNQRFAAEPIAAGADTGAQDELEVPAAPTDTYRVLRPTLVDGDLYTTGDALDLTAADAAPLLRKHHIDKPAQVTLVVRSEPTKLPVTPPMPTRVVEGTTSDPVPAAVAPADTITTGVAASS